MNYASIIKEDFANGEGVRVSLFVSGCTHQCKNCFNKDLWNFGYGKPFTVEVENKILEALNKPYIKGLSLLGGDPLMPQNRQAVLQLIERVRKELPKKDIWLWTGYTVEELSDCKEILDKIDVLVDGKFIEELADRKLKWRGSSNQRILRKGDRKIGTS